MDKEAPRVSVNLLDGQKEGVVLVGNAYHELVDTTATTFKTGNIISFTDYLKKFKSNEITIFYGNEEVSAWPASLDRYSKKIAECSCEGSPELNLIIKFHSLRFSPADFEKFLRQIRPCLCEKGKALLEHVKNIKVTKTTKVEQSKDNAGNFAYSVSRENTDPEQFQLPKELVFTAEIIDQCPDTIELKFEPAFHFEESQGSVAMAFSYENIRVGIELREARRKCIEKYIADLEFQKHYGSIIATIQDDSWKYKANPLTDK
jgi:hypothetical protein